jgi:protein TonB
VEQKVTAAQLLASTTQEIKRLTAELDRKTDAYAKRPRRKTLSASTQEYKYANYLDAWRRKVERVGNLNYPDEAKRRRLYGNLVLHVAIRPDGTVKTINVRKSSGHKLLDDAAIRIVKLSAPFAPFPGEIRKETDIIDIIRTWQFRNNDQLFSK